VFENINIFLFWAMVVSVSFNILVIYILRKKKSANGYHSQMKEIRNNQKNENLKNKKINKGSTVKNENTLIGYSGRTPICTPDNAKHIFICGTTGSGKTVALANYIKQAFNQEYPALIVDGKGDINSDSILAVTKQFAKETNRKTYVINLTDPESSDRYNPFKNATPTVCKDMLINMTEWSEEHYKVNTERYLQKVIMLMRAKNISFSFNTILKCISTEKFKSLSMDLQRNDFITKEEHLENVALADTSGKIAEGAVARFSLLLESELGCIFHEDGIDISTVLKENAVIIFILNPLIYSETSPSMGRLVLIDSKKAVSHLFNSNQRSFLSLMKLIHTPLLY